MNFSCRFPRSRPHRGLVQSGQGRLPLHPHLDQVQPPSRSALFLHLRRNALYAAGKTAIVFEDAPVDRCKAAESGESDGVPVPRGRESIKNPGVRPLSIETVGTSHGMLHPGHRPTREFESAAASAPLGVHCICCFFTNRLLTTWLIVDSTNAVLIVSPCRYRSPKFGMKSWLLRS